MLAQTLQGSATESGLRPFNPFRDLAQVADLVEDAFREELALTGSEIVAEMRRWSGWRSWLWLINPPDLMSGGFVWTEGGRIVGNISIGLANPQRGFWLISNVAVYPEYRRRGLARQLLETALDWVRSQGGRKVFLQVRVDNEGARQLYRSFGFSSYHVAVEMRRPAELSLPSGTGSALGWRNAGRRDSAAVRELIQAATPPEAQQFQFADDFLQAQRTFDDRVNDWLAGRRTYQQVIAADTYLGALLRVRAYRRAPQHFLTVLVHPQERGVLEKEAIMRGLALLQGFPSRPVLSTASASTPETVAVLAETDFTEIRRLDQMKLEFGS
jgi:ribosomal-protein-alanine N-acetyltransferase